MERAPFDNILKAQKLDESYEFLNPPSLPSPSLRSYLTSTPLSQWLLSREEQGAWGELGCGMRALLEDYHFSKEKDDLFAFDLSKIAIEKAKKKSLGKVHYFCEDLSLGLPHGPYSVLVDAHFLHCLNSLPELYQTLGKIRESLLPGGIFLGEVMISHKNLTFSAEFEFDVGSCVLYRGGVPQRLVMDAFEWEDMFLNSGFKIKYFICQSSIKIIPEDDREIPMRGDPECLRFCLERLGASQ